MDSGVNNRSRYFKYLPPQITVIFGNQSKAFTGFDTTHVMEDETPVLSSLNLYLDLLHIARTIRQDFQWQSDFILEYMTCCLFWWLCTCIVILDTEKGILHEPSKQTSVEIQILEL